MASLQQINKNLLEGPVIKSLFKLAVPIVLANVLQTAYQLTDAFWVGRLGGSAVAAVSVSFPVTFLMISMGAGLAVAGSTLIAQYFGAKNYKMVNHVAAQTLLMVVITSIVLGFLGYMIAPGVLRLMNVAPDVYQNALGFMRMSFVGMVFTFSFFMFQSVMRGVGQVTMPMYIVLGTVILNVILDPLFIYGWGPIPAMGVTGAAVATLGTQSIAAIIGLTTLLGGKFGIHLSWSDFKPDWQFVKKSFMLGFPVSIEQSARALGLTVMTFLIASFGTLTVASYGVGSNILNFVIIPAMGFSMAIATLAGQNIGAGNIKRASEIAKLGAIMSFSVLTAFGVLAFIFARYLITLFVPNDPGVIDVGAQYVRIMALSFGFLGLQFALVGVLRAAGKMMIAMILALVSQWVIQFPLAYVLSKHTSLGATGLWWAFPVTNIIMAIITTIWFMRSDWKKVRLTQEEKLTEKVTEETLVEEGVR